MDTASRSPRISLGILGRTPAPQQCKRRLAKTLGEDEALRIYQLLFRHTLRCAHYAHQSRPSLRPTLWYLGDRPTDYLNDFLHFEAIPQPGTDFAANMQAVIDRAADPAFCGALLIGTDPPELQPEHLVAAADALQHSDVWLAPTEDGGFWGLATRVPLPGIFAHMPFSVPTVFDELRQRIAARAHSLQVGPLLFDVDTADDWQRVSEKSLFR